MSFFKNKTKVLILILTIILAAIMAFSTIPSEGAGIVSNVFGTVITPVQKGIYTIVDAVEGFFKYFADMKNLERKNGDLKEEISALNASLRDMKDLETENEQLRSLLNLKKRNSDKSYIAAEVSSRNFNNWYCTLTIDKGSDDGVAVNDVILTSDGVVGYICEVGNSWSKVTGIIDSTSSAAAIARRTGDKSVVEGDINLMSNCLCKMPYIPKDSGITEGDEIYTSGDGGVYPEGLYIGTVEEISTSGDGMSKEAVIKAGASPYDVKSVFILKR